MCKYAMVAYKPHYACFQCRKTFKRRLLGDINRDQQESVDAKCPQCGEPTASMGYDFAAPKMSDVKAWEHLRQLYAVGINFHSCGCTGPGYIPNTKERLLVYLEEKIQDYNRQLAFWRQRREPQNERELNREYSKWWSFIGRVPDKLRPKRRAVQNEDAKKYWIGLIKDVEQKLETIKAPS